MTFSGLIDGGPLTEGPHPPTAMTIPFDVATLHIAPDGTHRLVPGRQRAPIGYRAVEYGWVWGVWLWGDQLAAARSPKGRSRPLDEIR